MKNIFQISAILGMLFLQLSCSDFLDEKVYSQLSDSNFYQTAKDAETAVNSIYPLLYLQNSGGYSTEILYLNEYLSEAVSSRLMASLDNSKYDQWQLDRNGQFGAIYSNAYKIIDRANQVLDNIHTCEMQESLRERIYGEAYFLRALAYFNMVRIWGGVPLKLSSTNELKELEIPRSSAAEIYEVIIADLRKAEELLWRKAEMTSITDLGRPTVTSAQTLLGKVYLTRNFESDAMKVNDLDSAIYYLNRVVESNEHALLSNYQDVFDYTNENNEEVIFDIQLIRKAGLGGKLTAFLPTNVSQDFYQVSYYDYPAALSFYDSFMDGDTRRDVTFHDKMNILVSGEETAVYFDKELAKIDPYGGCWRYMENNEAVPRGYCDAQVPGFRKFIDYDKENAGLNREEPNYIVLRYPDVLLMLAEAINERNKIPSAEAYECLNQVIRRAYSEATYKPVSNLTYDEFRYRVFEERRKEFVIECHNWFDGKRFWDIFTEKVVANANYDPYGNFGDNRSYNIRPKGPIDLNEIRQDKYKRLPIPIGFFVNNPKLTQNPGWEQ